MQDRPHFSTWDSVRHIWLTLGLPEDALSKLQLGGGDDVAAPSSYKIGHLAQSSIAVSGLLAALIRARRRQLNVPKVSIDRQHAVAEFQSEKLYLLNGGKSKPPWGSIGGLHKTKDGYVRVHDSFPHHHDLALKALGFTSSPTKAEFARTIGSCEAQNLEDVAAETGSVIFRMRNYAEWDDTAQARATAEFPVTVEKVAESRPHIQAYPANCADKCLAGIRVLEMSRVIAAPVAGKTLAAHGADVLWITSPNLPDLPDLDKDLGRGKRTAQLDINDPVARKQLLDLANEADVFLQSYRPGSLARRGLSMEDLLTHRASKPLIHASLSAWGSDGPWATRRGFDSIVQTASGMNVSEAEHYSDDSDARPMPCQALDHGAGYFLAVGIMTALYRQAVEGGSYQIRVSLAGVMKYLRSLGQYEGQSGFDCAGYNGFEDVPEEMTETRECAFGKLASIRHSVAIEGVEVGWEHMPKPLGSDEAVWLPR